MRVISLGIYNPIMKTRDTLLSAFLFCCYYFLLRLWSEFGFMSCWNIVFPFNWIIFLSENFVWDVKEKRLCSYSGNFKLHLLLYSIFTRRSIIFVKNLDFRFSTDLCVLKSHEHDLTAFTDCLFLSLCLSVSLSLCYTIFWGYFTSRTNSRNLIILQIQFDLDIHWYWLLFV